MILERNNNLTKEIVLVDGIGRTGKFYIANMISTFDRVEICSLINSFDTIPKLWSMGKISDDAAISYLRIESDLHLYNNLIGRNINLRKGDSTSLLGYCNSSEYLDRMESKDDPADNDSIFQTVSHDALMNSEILMKAFNDRLRMLHVIRNPIDIIYSWYIKGFGHRIGEDPTDMDITQKVGSRYLPIYLDNPDDYINMNEYEKVIAMVDYCMRENLNGYKNLSKEERSRVKVIDLDNIRVEEIAKFIRTKSTSYTKDLMLSVNHINKSNDLDRETKSRHIYSNIREDYRDLISSVFKCYNEFVDISELND